VIYNTNVTEILGDGNKVTGVKLDASQNNSDQLLVDGIFIEIGAVPGTGLASQLGVTLDEVNYILVGEDMSTNLPGVFGAGDLTDNSKNFAQMIGACAQGAIAAASAYKYIKGEKAPRILGN
jgi:thioredoxin reductase (NADPH)